jgi:hypothetical protein
MITGPPPKFHAIRDNLRACLISVNATDSAPPSGDIISRAGSNPDLPIFRSLDNSSPNTVHVRHLHRRIDPNPNDVDERRRMRPKMRPPRARLLADTFARGSLWGRPPPHSGPHAELEAKAPSRRRWCESAESFQLPRGGPLRARRVCADGCRLRFEQRIDQGWGGARLS